MQFPRRALTIAIVLFLTGSVSSQDLDGLKILVLSASPTTSSANPRNAIWKGLEAEGVDVTFVRDNLSKYKLDRFDQLWIFGSSQFDARFFTKRDFQAFTQFAKNGRGLYLLSDAAGEFAMPAVRPPARRIGYSTFEANVIAYGLFQANVHGCYEGQQILRLTDSAPSHPLLKNVHYLAEGGDRQSHIEHRATRRDRLCFGWQSFDRGCEIAGPERCA